MYWSVKNLLFLNSTKDNHTHSIHFFSNGPHVCMNEYGPLDKENSGDFLSPNFNS